MRAARPVSLTLGLTASVLLASSDAGEAARKRFCSDTARAQYVACQNEVKDDRLTQKALCINLGDDEERAECLDEYKAARAEGNEECAAQRDARRDLCDLLGVDRYDPDFDPADFDADFVTAAHLNTYYPIKVGNFWAYDAGEETNTVEVLPKTKLIEGVTCAVIRDLVKLNGTDKEDTDDWIAQSLNGDAVYCGEEVKDFETFPGDDPNEPELVEIAGSFKIGRDGAKPGTLFLGTPTVDATYRQEWLPGEAEDAVTVLSTTYGYGHGDPTLDLFVPQDLADHLCNDDCVVTADFTPLDPEVLEHKYYAPNVGQFLEVDVATGEINRLVDCNVDPKCASIPQP
jgi:hypothetical protein